jgi:hypothetical protein
VGRAEEVHAQRPLRVRRGGCDSVDIERGGVGREQCRRAAQPAQAAEDLALERQGLEDGFDHRLGGSCCREVGLEGDRRRPRLAGFRRHPTLGHARRVNPVDRRARPFERFGGCVDQAHGDARIGKKGGNPAAHRARADDGGAFDRRRGGAVQVSLGHPRKVRR